MTMNYQEQAEKLHNLNCQLEALDKEKQDLLNELRNSEDAVNWSKAIVPNLDLFKELSKEESLAESIEGSIFSRPRFNWPILVEGITQEDRKLIKYNTKSGKFVSIRWVKDNKTYLGLYLGELPLSASYEFNKLTKVLKIGASFYNPAIFVFDLNKVVFGMESWWGVLENQQEALLSLVFKKELKKISDEQIQNIPYVKALKALEEGDRETAEKLVVECLTNVL